MFSYLPWLPFSITKGPFSLKCLRWNLGDSGVGRGGLSGRVVSDKAEKTIV